VCSRSTARPASNLRPTLSAGVRLATRTGHSVLHILAHAAQSPQPAQAPLNAAVSPGLAAACRQQQGVERLRVPDHRPSLLVRLAASRLLPTSASLPERGREPPSRYPSPMQRETADPQFEPSDAERSAAQDVLRDAVGAGLLTLDEFSERVRVVWFAKRKDELTRSVSDIAESLEPDSGTITRIVALCSDQTRSGRWRVPQLVRGIALAGDIELDLRGMVCSGDTVELRFWSILGGVGVCVPEGVDVDLAGLDFLGTRQLNVTSVPAPPSAPRVRVRVTSVAGAVAVYSAVAGGTALKGARRGQRSRRWAAAAAVTLALGMLWLWIGNRQQPVATNTSSPAIPTSASGTSLPQGSQPTLSALPSSPILNQPVVPDVVGDGLPEAIANLQRVGLDNVQLVDGSGQKRTVVKYENWTVREQQPPAGSAVSGDLTAVLTVSKPTDSLPDVAVSAGVVPSVVCRDLQAALQALGAAGYSNVDSIDGSGQGRTPILPLNWIVIAQSVNGGQRPPLDISIGLTVVKYREDTESSGCHS
jgi:hypothetical protein